MDNPTKNQRLLHAFTPNKFELIVLPVLSFVYLLVSSIITRLRATSGEDYQLVSEFIETNLREGLSIVDRLAGSTLLTMLFWMFIGFCFYLLTWVAGATYQAYRDDIPITKGVVLPRGYSSSKVIHEALARFAVRFISTVFLVTWLYLFFSKILPYCSESFLNNVSSFSFSAFKTALITTLVLSVSIFIVFVLMRCIVLRDRVFGVE